MSAQLPLAPKDGEPTADSICRAQPQAQPGQPAPQRPPPAMLEKLSRTIHLWVKGNYDTAMRFVAYAELAILARSVLGAVT